MNKIIISKRTYNYFIHKSVTTYVSILIRVYGGKGEEGIKYLVRDNRSITLMRPLARCKISVYLTISQECVILKQRFI